MNLITGIIVGGVALMAINSPIPQNFSPLDIELPEIQQILPHRNDLDPQDDTTYLKEIISHYSSLQGVSEDLAISIAKAESNLDPQAKNPESTASGLFQLTEAYIQDFCPDIDPFNPEQNTECAMKRLALREWWRWAETADKWENQPWECSCVKGARKFIDIPLGTNAEDLQPNSSPVEGGLVLFKYDNISHIGVILDLGKTMKIVEWNKEKCRKTYREVAYNDESIVGFWYN